MATKYISTTGNDTTGDGSSGNPYLTISKGISVASANDTIEVAAGTYNEKLVIGDTSLIFNASGVVILDGTIGALTTPAVAISTTTGGRAITFQSKPSTSGTWEFKKYSGASLVTLGATAAQTITFANTTFTSNANTYGVNSSAGNYLVYNQTGCTFTNFLTSALYTAGGSYAIFGSTYTNNPTAITFNGNMSGMNFTGNTVTNCTSNFISSNAAGMGSNVFANNTYTNVNGWTYGSRYSYSGWKALGANCDNSGSTFNSCWNGVIYVNKSGSDSNNGFSSTSAKLTIQAGLSAATVSGTNVIVGSGAYNEKISFSGTGAVCSLNADGTVILDGTGLSYGPAITMFNVQSSTQTISAVNDTGGKWIIQNYSADSLITNYGSSNVTAIISNVELYSNSNQYGLYYYTSTAPNSAVTMGNCIFSGFPTAVYHYSTGQATKTYRIYNCTFYNGTTAIYYDNPSSTTTYSNYVILSNNIFSTFVTAWNIVRDVTGVISDKNQFHSITNWKKVASTYTTLEDAQAAGYELTSIVEDPQFIDSARSILYKKVISSLGRSQGAIPFGFTTGSNNSDASWVVGSVADNSGWYCSDGSVAKNGSTGFLELSSGSVGVVVSPVYDLTSVQAIRRINLAVDQTWGVSMIDTTKTDTKPNYQTVEIRGSGVTFAQNAVSPAWTEVKTEQPISPIVGRFVQLRLTFRSDDAEA